MLTSKPRPRLPRGDRGHDPPYSLTAGVRPCATSGSPGSRGATDAALRPCLDLAGGAAENGAVTVSEPEDAQPAKTGRFLMSLGSPVRTALALLASVLVAVAAPAPGEAKVLRTNLRADPAMVDPVTYSELVAGDVMKNLYEGFTEIDKDGNVVPALAVRWEANPDNKGFRFHLRKGVKFHSGREFRRRTSSGPSSRSSCPATRAGSRSPTSRCWRGRRRSRRGRRRSSRGSRWSTPTRWTCGSREPTCCSRSIRSSSWTAGSSRSTAPTGPRRSRPAPDRSSSCTGSAGRRSGWRPTRTTGGRRRRSTRSRCSSCRASTPRSRCTRPTSWTWWTSRSSRGGAC